MPSDEGGNAGGLYLQHVLPLNPSWSRQRCPARGGQMHVHCRMRIVVCDHKNILNSVWPNAMILREQTRKIRPVATMCAQLP